MEGTDVPRGELKSLSGPYGARAVRFFGYLDAGDVRLKVIGITLCGERPHARLVEAAKVVAEQHVRERPTRHSHYGAGFLGLHDGRGENQVFLDLWVNENELLHTVWVSPKGDAAALRRCEEDHKGVCVWDLAVEARERELWISHLLGNARGPDVAAYLAARWDADV